VRKLTSNCDTKEAGRDQRERLAEALEFARPRAIRLYAKLASSRPMRSGDPQCDGGHPGLDTQRPGPVRAGGGVGTREPTRTTRVTERHVALHDDG
jgi:hypothetical protein